MIVVARVHSEMPEKFGIPRQSGLVEALRAELHFEPRFRSWDAVRGLEEYSHLWLLWGFSEAAWNGSLTVAPPRLGGKVRKGVFATRSPYRPNSIGLSCVRLLEIRRGAEGEPVLLLGGADLLDGTPVYDIKPYLPYADSHPEAEGGFGEAHRLDALRVDFPEALLAKIPEARRAAAVNLLALDPRAAYNKEPDYVYGMAFAGLDIRFRVEGDTVRVLDVETRGAEKIK